MNGFVEISDLERRSEGKFRPYAAHREWAKDSRTGLMVEVETTYRPGHKLPNGNWLIPQECIVALQP